jgi:hypothetical protein
MTAYEIAREIANSGDERLLCDTLYELAANWPNTYKEAAKELYATLEWLKDEDEEN